MGITFVFYRGDYEAPEANLPSFERIQVTAAPARGIEEVSIEREGVLLLDDDHRNDFDEEEINILLARVTDRGYAIQLLEDRDQLSEKLNNATTFVVILPRRSYVAGEIATVKEFVDGGGKLLLIGDPGRPSDINSLAREFGVVFQPGYLYNVAEHDLNFQNIFIKDFRPDEITHGLERIVFYTSGPIKSSGPLLAISDGNTYSSMVERTEPFSPIVKGSSDRVLAISDLTFMIPPFNALWDNERLIANLADYLTKSERILFE